MVKLRETQIAMKQIEIRFANIIHRMADRIWKIDSDGKFTFVSGHIRRILGCGPEKLIGTTPFELMPEKKAGQNGDIKGFFKKTVVMVRTAHTIRKSLNGAG